MIPMISVLMPVYNCRQYIEESVNSILNQTYENFELIIIDDCSTDGTYDYLCTLSDARIILTKKERNSGYINSLNSGIQIAKGKYLARMDGDDISDLNRFETQVNYLEKYKDIGLCGSFAKFIDSGNIWRLPVENDEIKACLFYTNVMIHPSVMIRAEILKNSGLLYNPSSMPAEDYDLWNKLARFTDFHNIPEPLLFYRLHKDQVSELLGESQFVIHENIRDKLLFELTGKDLDEKSKKLNRELTLIAYKKNQRDISSDFDCWIRYLIRCNNLRKIYPVRIFKKSLLSLISDEKKRLLTRKFINDRISIREISSSELRLFFTMSFRDKLLILKKLLKFL